MERAQLLSLVVLLVATPAFSVTIRCINGNCTEIKDAPGFGLNLGSIFPFFGPVDLDANQDRAPADDIMGPMESPEDEMDPMEAPTNESDTTGGIFSIKIMRVVSFPKDQDTLDQPKGDLDLPMGPSPVQSMEFGPPLLQRFFDNFLARVGILDLSGRNLTSEQVRSQLRARWAQGHPVTTLILSNSRVHPMDAGTFAPAEGSITTLVLANTSVNPEALTGLTNLRVLNLSNNALSTLPWYGLMSNTLEVLDLSNNKFVEIRPELAMLKSLRELYISNNDIETVEKSPLNLMPNLEMLDLSNNQLERVNLAGLDNLIRVNLDWNFLRQMGTDCQLPSQSMSLKLASNPWRCDCTLLYIRDNNEILDLDQLQCANHLSYSYCDDCPREFLPPATAEDRQAVALMTTESINHLGCYDLQELLNAMSRLRQEDPDKLYTSICLFVALFLLFTSSALLTIIKCCRKNNVKRKFWLQVKQIPHLDKIGKPQEVPYIKIDEPVVA